MLNITGKSPLAPVRKINTNVLAEFRPNEANLGARNLIDSGHFSRY